MTSEPDQQALDLPGLARQAARLAPKPAQKAPVRAAETDPVASVLVDVPLAHLDRPFDYTPSTLKPCPAPESKCALPAKTSMGSWLLARPPATTVANCNRCVVW